MSSDSEDEDFVSYGTPVEPLDEDLIPRKRSVTVEDQVATDKHGRRRFHGAFTGGFSAGFFNTVGSLEGWKPSQFKSSRSLKSETQTQRPEDFMDDEDMDEFGIAPKILRPTADYNQSAEGNDGFSRKRRLMQASQGPIPGIPVLKTLIEPVRETIGIKLLKKMGWRKGQGVGPRLSNSEKRASKKLQKEVKLYGCALPNQENKIDEDSESEEELDTNVTFAPDDFEPYVVKPKDDCFGLGYSGLERRPVLSHFNLFGPETSSLVMEEKKKKVSIRGQAFGVGAFEKEDEDIYAAEDMSQYDFALDTPQQLAEKRQSERNAKLKSRSSNGDVLEGFVLSSTPLLRKTYPPPPLPPGFNPHHQHRESRFSAATVPQSRKVLSANERAAILDEPLSVNKSPLQTLGVTEKRADDRTTLGFRPFAADPEKQDRYEKFISLSNVGQPEKLKSLQPFTMTEWERERERVEFEGAARLYKPLSAVFSERFVNATQPDDLTDPLAQVAKTADPYEELRNAAKLKMFGKLTRRVSDWAPHSVLCKRFNIPQPSCTNNSMQSKTTRPKFSVFNFLDAAPFNTSTTLSSTNEKKVSSENLAEGPGDNLNDATISKSVVSTASTSGANTSACTTTISPEAMDCKESEATAKDNELDKLVDATNKMDLYKAIFQSSSDESDSEDNTKDTSLTTNEQNAAEKSTTELSVLRNASPPRGIFANLDLATTNSQKVIPHFQEKSASEFNVLRNTSPPKGIFANLDLDQLKKQPPVKTVSSINNENSLVCFGKETEKNSSPDTSESYGPCLPKTSCTSRILSLETNENFNEQTSKSGEMYGPSLPSKTKIQSKDNSCVDIGDSNESEDNWVEMDNSSDSDKISKHSSNKKHRKKSHRKSKKHKEKKHKHKKSKK